MTFASFPKWSHDSEHFWEVIFFQIYRTHAWRSYSIQFLQIHKWEFQLDWHTWHQRKLNGLHSVSARLDWANPWPSNWISEGLWNSGSWIQGPYWQCLLWIHSALWQSVWFTRGMPFEILLSSTERRLVSRFCFASANKTSLSFSTCWIVYFGTQKFSSRSWRTCKGFGRCIFVNEEIAISESLSLFSNRGWLWQCKAKLRGIHTGWFGLRGCTESIASDEFEGSDLRVHPAAQSRDFSRFFGKCHSRSFPRCLGAAPIGFGRQASIQAFRKLLWAWASTHWSRAAARHIDCHLIIDNL